VECHENEPGRLITIKLEMDDLDPLMSEFRECIRRSCETVRYVFIDLSEIDGLVSVLIGALISAQKKQTEKWMERGRLVLVGMSPTDRKLLSKAKLIDFFTSCDTLDEALSILPKHRIAIIDRDDDMYDYISTVLEVNKFECARIDVGDAMIQALEEFDPTMILTEIDLGGISVGSLCKEIEAHARLSKCSILIGTAYHQMDIPKEVAHYPRLTKPFKPNDLLSEIQKLFETK